MSMNHYTSQTPIEEIIYKETCRIAYKLSKARGYGRSDEDWYMAEQIINDRDWQGTGKSYKDVIIDYYHANRHLANKNN